MLVEGIKTTIPLHRRIMDDPDFLAGNVHTGFMDRYQVPKKVAAVS
jgi:acetyl-CoA carboxylase biotin carboxylase subunit